MTPSPEFLHPRSSCALTTRRGGRLGSLPRLLAAVTGAVLLLGIGATVSAQTHTGDVLGDLIHIKRDPTTGQPIAGAPVFLRFALVPVAPSPAAGPDIWWVDGIELATSPPVADLTEGRGGFDR